MIFSTKLDKTTFGLTTRANQKHPKCQIISEYLMCVFNLYFLKLNNVYYCFINDIMIIKLVNTTTK